MIINHHKRDRRRRLIFGLVGVIILLAFSYVGFGLYRQSIVPPVVIKPVTQLKVVQQPVAAKVTAYGLPVRLLIPKIKVDANVLYVGLDKTGNMDVPPDLLNVGWYKFGPIPGDKGSAVIAGHLVGVKDLGVFANLHLLQPGDNLSVLDDKGATTSFVVRESRSYGQLEEPNEVFHSSDGNHLNLITCTGVWVKELQRYTKRLVVFADRV